MNKTVYLISTPAGDIETGHLKGAKAISLVFLRDYLIRHGISSEIIDGDADHLNNDGIISRLLEKNANIVGFTSYTTTRFITYDAIRKLKIAIPDCKIIVGGRHFSSLAEEALENLLEVDYVVRGEGEVSLFELSNAILRSNNVDKIEGITYRNNGSIISTPDRPLEDNLDDIYYDYRKMTKEDISVTTMRLLNTKRFAVMAGRGCPYGCVFCTLKATKARFRSIDDVMNEIEHKIKVTGVKSLSFSDSTLTANKEFIEKLCKEIIRRNLNIKWSCYSRVDINAELLDLMKSAGLVSVDVALESGSPRVLKIIRKKINVDQLTAFVKKCFFDDIRINVFVLLGHPDEREVDAEMTYELIYRLREYISSVSLNVTKVFPDAALDAIARERGVIPKDFSWFEPYEDKNANMINEGHGFRNKNTLPHYIEYLSVKYINDIMRRIHDLQLYHFYTYSMLKVVTGSMWRTTLCDWHSEGVCKKLRRLKRVIVVLVSIMKTYVIRVNRP